MNLSINTSVSIPTTTTEIGKPSTGKSPSPQQTGNNIGLNARQSTGMARRNATLPQMPQAAHIDPNIARMGNMGAVGAMPAKVASEAVALGNAGLKTTDSTMNASMDQMGEIMKMQMKHSNDMALGKLATTVFEGMTKEIKKTGDGVKNLSG